MPKFRVFVREVWVQPIEIDASDKEKAIAMVKDCLGNYSEIEYSHTLDVDTWTIEEL